MGFEKFQPLPEETAKAEQIMTKTEARLSAEREGAFKKSKEAGLENPLTKRRMKEPKMGIDFGIGGEEIEGIVNGHKILLFRGPEKFHGVAKLAKPFLPKYGFAGNVDGKWVSEGDAKKLWAKYDPMAIREITGLDRANVKVEVTDEVVAKTLEELGL